MLGFVNAIHVTPGPFSIFRKEVFEKIGPYRHAHTTEDQEIALQNAAKPYENRACARCICLYKYSSDYKSII